MATSTSSTAHARPPNLERRVYVREQESRAGVMDAQEFEKNHRVKPFGVPKSLPVEGAATARREAAGEAAVRAKSSEGDRFLVEKDLTQERESRHMLELQQAMIETDERFRFSKEAFEDMNRDLERKHRFIRQKQDELKDDIVEKNKRMIGLEAKISRAKKKSNDEKKLNARLAEELRAKEDKVRLLVGRQSMVQRFRTSFKKYEDFMLRSVDHLMSGTQDSNAGTNLLGGEFVLGSTPESLVEKYDRLSQHVAQLARKLDKRERALLEMKELVARKKQEALTKAAKLSVDFRIMRNVQLEAHDEVQEQDLEQTKQMDVEKMRQLNFRKIKTVVDDMFSRLQSEIRRFQNYHPNRMEGKLHLIGLFMNDMSAIVKQWEQERGAPVTPAVLLEAERARNTVRMQQLQQQQEQQQSREKKSLSSSRARPSTSPAPGLRRSSQSGTSQYSDTSSTSTINSARRTSYSQVLPPLRASQLSASRSSSRQSSSRSQLNFGIPTAAWVDQ